MISAKEIMVFSLLHRVWPALRSRNLRLFTAGQTFSLIGTFVQQVAMGWLVYRLTRSTFILGVVGFLSDFPGAAVVLISGIILDRVSPYRILLATQALAMLQAFLLAVLVLGGQVDIALIFILACFLGLLNGFEVPARQVLVSRLIEDKADLQGAIALNALINNLARLIGPPLGGFLVAEFGEWICFLMNSASYLAVLVALLAMRGIRQPEPSRPLPALTMLFDGLRYSYSAKMILAIVMLVAFVAFGAAPYATLLPVMATRVSQSGPNAMGILMGAMAAGSLLGALFLAKKPDILQLEHVVIFGAALFGACLVLFGLSQSLVLSSLVILTAGFGVTSFMASCSTLLLSISDSVQRGRVMSLFTLSYMGTVPIGAFVAGLVATRLGPPMTLIIGGMLCLSTALAFGFCLPRLRPLSKNAEAL